MPAKHSLPTRTELSTKSFLGRRSLATALLWSFATFSNPSTIVDAWSQSKTFQGRSQSHSSLSPEQSETALFLNGIQNGVASPGLPHNLPSVGPNPSRPQTPGATSHGSSTVATSASASLAIPETASLSPSMFEERMKQLVSKKQVQRHVTTKHGQPRKRLPSNVIVVNSMEEYKQVVGDETQKVVAVRFHAHWCRACKLIEPLFYHMASKFPNVLFVDVPVTQENSNLHQGLGIPSLPFGHLYHPNSGLVEELKMTRKLIPAFVHKLETYRNGICDVEYHENDSESQAIKCPYPPIHDV